jgi:arylsulfatase A-like enzyme
LVFYGPGVVTAGGEVDRPATLGDVAPTLAVLLKGTFRTEDGRTLPEVARFEASLLRTDSPRLVVVVVWDGGGWNVLRQWPDAWPNLKRAMSGGVSYTDAIVGSSPSVTPSVHTTIGTGVFPWKHGITGINVRDENGDVVDAFYRGESSHLLEVPTLAERWDELQENRALIGMIGYEPWHLGMIGQGAERPGGDKDHAAWLNVETNVWISNPDNYTLPESLATTPGLEEGLRRLDARDGKVDDSWMDHQILNDRTRIEEVPAFIAYHGRGLRRMIAMEGYGDDEITDFLFTNFKQIDRVGHYFNMASEEVRQSVVETDRQLGELFDFLDDEVGREKWVTVITADHGQQPDAGEIDGYGIDPIELDGDIEDEFGSVLQASWATELFLDPRELDRRDLEVADVAEFMGGYRLRDNVLTFAERFVGAGSFAAGDRLYDMAIPGEMVRSISCSPE